MVVIWSETVPPPAEVTGTGEIGPARAVVSKGDVCSECRMFPTSYRLGSAVYYCRRTGTLRASIYTGYRHLPIEVVAETGEILGVTPQMSSERRRECLRQLRALAQQLHRGEAA